MNPISGDEQAQMHRPRAQAATLDRHRTSTRPASNDQARAIGRMQQSTNAPALAQA